MDICVPMDYDRQLLKSWLESGDWADYLEEHGALRANVSTQQFKAIERRYFAEIKRRIAYCEKLLANYQDDFIYYVLAVLYSRCDLNESASLLYMQKVRYYCFKAIRKTSNFAPSWALLAEAYSWIACLGGESPIMPELRVSCEKVTVELKERPDFRTHLTKDQTKSICYIERAIHCINKALKLEPMNTKYQSLSESYYSQRNGYFR